MEEDTKRLHYVLDILTTRYSRDSPDLGQSRSGDKTRGETQFERIPSDLLQLIVNYLPLGEEFLLYLIFPILRLRPGAVKVLPILWAHYILIDEVYSCSLLSNYIAFNRQQHVPSRYSSHVLHSRVFTRDVAFEGCFYLTQERTTARLGALQNTYQDVFGGCLECWSLRHCNECDLKDPENQNHTCSTWEELLHHFVNSNPYYIPAFINGESLNRDYWTPNLTWYCFYDKLEEFGFAGDVLLAFQDGKLDECLNRRHPQNTGAFLNHAIDRMEQDGGKLVDYVISKFPQCNIKQSSVPFRKKKRAAILDNNLERLDTLCRMQQILRPLDHLSSTYCYTAIEMDSPECYQMLVNYGHDCGTCPELVKKYYERTVQRETPRYAKMYRLLYQ
jgi:hypothetical protein